MSNSVFHNAWSNKINQSEREFLNMNTTQMSDPDEELNFIVEYLKDQNLPVEGDSLFTGQWEQMSKICSFLKNPLFCYQLNSYNQEFRFWAEFRSHFATAIEKRDWLAICSNDFASESTNVQRARRVICELQEEICVHNNNTQQVMIEDNSVVESWWTTLNEFSVLDPIQFVRTMQQMLARESSLITLASQLPEFLFQTFSDRQKQIDKSMRDMEEVVEGFVNYISEDTTCSSECSSSEGQWQNNFGVQAMEEHVTAEAVQSCLERKVLTILNSKENVRLQIETVLLKVKEEIHIWKRGQAYANNGLCFVNMDHITNLEIWSKQLFKVLRSCMEKIVKVIEKVQISQLYEYTVSLDETLQEYALLLKDLIESCLIVEKHPSQVVKTKTYFECQARHLLSEELNFHQAPPQASLSLITAEDAEEVKKGHDPRSPKTTLVERNVPKCLFFMENETPRLKFAWNNLKLEKRLKNRSCSKIVTAEKQCVMISIGVNFPLPRSRFGCFDVKALSLPVVVIAAAKQTIAAKGTCFWDNAASAIHRERFQVPLEIPLHFLMENLEGIWKKNCEPSPSLIPGLDEIARKGIVKKIYGRTDVDLETLISWDTLYHNNMHNRKFTFWKYFSQTMALTSSPKVKELWNLRRIVGFVEREESEEILKGCQMGTFLLRFSQLLWGRKERAGLVVSCIDCKDGVPDFGHYFPYTTKDLELHSLSDIIYCIDGKFQNLKFLYPNIPKETVFGPKNQSSFMSSKGYIRVGLSTT